MHRDKIASCLNTSSLMSHLTFYLFSTQLCTVFMVLCSSLSFLMGNLVFCKDQTISWSLERNPLECTHSCHNLIQGVSLCVRRGVFKAVRACAKAVSQMINRGVFSSLTRSKRTNEDIDKLLEVQSQPITVKYHPLMTNRGMSGILLFYVR